MLTPEEVQSREFLVSLRGYDRDEVHKFLSQVAEQLAQTEAKAVQLQQRLDTLKAQQPSAAAAAEPAPDASSSGEPSAMFAQIGKETQRILEAAQDAGQEIQRKARQEADRDLQGARGQAAKVIAEGERRREHIERVVSDLEQARAAMSAQLQALARTIEQSLRELAPQDQGGSGDGTSTVREAIASQAATQAPPAQDEAAPTEQAPDPGEDATDAREDATDAGEDAAPEAPADPVITSDEGVGDGGQAAATEPAMPTREDETGDGPPDAQALRAAALSPLHPRLARMVKRELQEIQNIALDKIRRSRGEWTVEEFLPTSDDIKGLGEGADPLLRQAWEAGVASAAVLAGSDLRDGGDAPDLAGAFLGDGAERVRSGLSSTLRMGHSADEGQQALSDRIGAVFSEFKMAQAEELAATHLIRAYEYGLLGAWSQGGIAARRWVVGREPRCPEAKCRSNDQGGGVPVTDAFPSGHEVPPVHVGCTCTTVPETSSA